MKAGMVVAALIMGLSINNVALAEPSSDGTALLHNCELMLHPEQLMSADRASVLGAGRCLGVVEGARNTMVFIADMKKMNPPFMCVKGGGFVTNEQAMRVVVKYLNAHPEQLHMDQVALTMMSLVDAFPCK